MKISRILLAMMLQDANVAFEEAVRMGKAARTDYNWWVADYILGRWPLSLPQAQPTPPEVEEANRIASERQDILSAAGLANPSMLD